MEPTACTVAAGTHFLHIYSVRVVGPSPVLGSGGSAVVNGLAIKEFHGRLADGNTTLNGIVARKLCGAM